MNSNSDNSSEAWVSNHDLANQVINKYTAKPSLNANKRKSTPVIKDDEEYQKKRARNNVAVKKSREKAKNRIQDTQVRVEQLTKENEELQTKVTLLSKELNVLRALFTNGGFTLPCDLQFVNSNSSPSSEHSPSAINHRYSPHSRLSGEDSVLSQSSPLHASFETEKSNYHSLEESNKIPPLRPTPRVPPNTSSHKLSSILPTSLKYSADHIYLQQKQSLAKSKLSSTGPPLLIQPGPQSVAATHSSLMKGDTRHPSVIRSTTEIVSPSSNTMGKLCYVNELQNNGRVKIVSINS